MNKKQMSKAKAVALSEEYIGRRIFLIRGVKVMIDRDLANLYDVETRSLKQAVTRNKDRFPDDFMFKLSTQEVREVTSQIVMLQGQHFRYPPMVFTEQGVAMLSSILKSKRAVQVNIQIMRTFAKLRQMLASNEELRRKVEDMEARYDEQFKVVFETMKRLLVEEDKPKRRVGF